MLSEFFFNISTISKSLESTHFQCFHCCFTQFTSLILKKLKLFWEVREKKFTNIRMPAECTVFSKMITEIIELTSHPLVHLFDYFSKSFVLFLLVSWDKILLNFLRYILLNLWFNTFLLSSLTLLQASFLFSIFSWISFKQSNSQLFWTILNWMILVFQEGLCFSFLLATVLLKLLPVTPLRS